MDKLLEGTPDGVYLCAKSEPLIRTMAPWMSS